MAEYKINQEILQAILNYLTKQPYIEVFQLIVSLQNCEKIGDIKPKKEDVRKD